MNITEWTRQLEALREGTLRLEGAEESGLTCYASSHLYELREYVKALEHGYRALWAALEDYRARERTRRKLGLRSLEEENGALRVKAAALEANQWSEGAALGYAGMALIQSSMPPHQVVALLELMEELMELYSLDDAADFHQGLKDGGDGSSGGRPVTAPTESGRPVQARLAPGPRWGPAGSAGGLCTEAQAMPLGGFAPTGDGRPVTAPTESGRRIAAPTGEGPVDGGEPEDKPQWIGASAELQPDVEAVRR